MDLLARLKDQLGAAYRVESELGGGGMSRVFLADEVAFGRRVVIKVLAPEVAAGVSAARFDQEIRFAARLQHPHIVPLLTGGAVDGLPWYSMPYVEGESLRLKLDREKRLSAGTTIEILRHVSAALAHAHDSGIVHRDIKPENILLSHDIAMVADFGVAKALEAGRATDAGNGTDAAGITDPGLAVGTFMYTSPEQALGERAVDGRSDMYALGTMAYEMLTGAAPFAGRSVRQLIAAHAQEAPAPLTGHAEDVPRPLGNLVMRCLAKQASERPTAPELLNALDEFSGHGESALSGWRWRKFAWIGFGIAAALLLIAGGSVAALSPSTRASLLTLLRRPARALDAKRVVVAALENRTGDSSLTVLGEMAADVITQRIAQTGEFDVVDARSAEVTAAVLDRLPRVFKAGDRAIALAKESGAGTLVSGSYYGDGDSLRVQLRVLDMLSQRVRPVESVSGSRGQLSALVDRAATRATGALASAIDTVTAWWGQPSSLEAYRLATAGFDAHLRYDTAAGLRMVRQSQRADSLYSTPVLYEAILLSEYGRWRELDGVLARLRKRWTTLTPPERLATESIEAVRRGANAEAARRFEALSKQNGSGDIVLMGVAQFAIRANQPKQALAALERMDPQRGMLLVNPLYWKWKAMAYWQLDEHDAELETAKGAAKQFPENPKVWYLLVRAHAALGHVSDVARLLRELPPGAAPPGYTRDTWIASATLHAARVLRGAGRAPEATRLLESLAPTAGVWGAGPGGAYLAALVAYERGDLGEARALAQRAAAQLPTNVDIQGLMGLVAAREGKVRDAEQWAAHVARRTDAELLRGRGHYWQARIAAALGRADEANARLREAVNEGMVLNLELPEVSEAEDFDVRLDAGFSTMGTPPLAQFITPDATCKKMAGFCWS